MAIKTVPPRESFGDVQQVVWTLPISTMSPTLAFLLVQRWSIAFSTFSSVSGLGSVVSLNLFFLFFFVATSQGDFLDYFPLNCWPLPSHHDILIPYMFMFCGSLRSHKPLWYLIILPLLQSQFWGPPRSDFLLFRGDITAWECMARSMVIFYSSHSISDSPTHGVWRFSHGGRGWKTTIISKSCLLFSICSKPHSLSSSQQPDKENFLSWTRKFRLREGKSPTAMWLLSHRSREFKTMTVGCEHWNHCAALPLLS